MKLRACKKCSIFDLEHHPICDAEVIRTAEDFARIRIPQSNIVGECLETEMYVTFYDNSYGLVTYLCRISRDKEGNHIGKDNVFYNVYECRFLKQESIIQRRSDYKIPIQIETKFYYKNKEDVIGEVEGTIMDLSAGGIFFICKKRFDLLEQVSFPFSNKDNIITLNCEIIRTQKPSDYREDLMNQDGIYGYGCRFVELNPREETAVRRFVFQEELKIHREKKEQEKLIEE